MSLFNISDIKDQLDDLSKDSDVLLLGFDEIDNRVGKLNSNVLDVFNKVDFNKTCHYVSCGLWSSHELLYYILQSIGPAHVTIATWSMSSAAAVKLINMLEVGLIRSLTGVLDFRTKNRHPEAFQLSQSAFTKLRLVSCHAKVTLIQNANYQLCITGSANYTNNPRIEAGVITHSLELCQFHQNWITKLLDNGEPFE